MTSPAKSPSGVSSAPEELSGEAWEMSHLAARFEFVILRNWNRVPVGRIAAVLAATAVRQSGDGLRMIYSYCASCGGGQESRSPEVSLSLG